MNLILKSIVAILIPLVLFVVAWFYEHGLVSKEVVDRAESISEVVENSTFFSATNTDEIKPTEADGEKKLLIPNEAQTKVLETIGLDADNLSFSEAEIKCFKEKLSDSRVGEIINGDVPSFSEIYKVKDCLSE